MIESEGEKSRKHTILGVLIVMSGIAAAILFVSSPIDKLLGDSAYKMHGAIHGLFAGVFMITVTIGLYEAFRLWAGLKFSVRELEIGSLISAFTCFLTIASGNWIYIPYRSSGGPRSQFLESVPEIHQIFFEFKEFTALFTLPLIVTAAYLICRYSDRIISNKKLRELVALLLVLTFFYFVIAFGLGAAVTKLKSV